MSRKKKSGELTEKQKKYREREAVPIVVRSTLSTGNNGYADRANRKYTRMYNRRARSRGFANAQEMYDWMVKQKQRLGQ